MSEELDVDAIDFGRLLTSIDQLGASNPKSDYSRVNTLQKMLDFIANNR